MRDRPLLLLIAAFLVAGQLEGWAQAVQRSPRASADYNNAPRAEAVDPRLGAGSVPGAMPAMPVGPSAGTRPGALVDPSHKLQPGDELTFKIEQDNDEKIPLVVSHTGEVVVEPLEQAVRVVGMTVQQAAAEIKRLLEKDYYYKATVRLTLTASNRNATMGYVYLDGLVLRVGALEIYPDRPMRLSEAILRAGGFARYAKDNAVRVTRVVRGGPPQILVSDQAAVREKGRLDQDLLLQDGDRIYVPQRFFQY